MPVNPRDINASTKDPTVEAQYDDSTPKSKQVSEFYSMIDSLPSCLLTTQRPKVGPVSRCMVLASRTGPDFLFLFNLNSRKAQDLSSSSSANISFLDSKTQNWISISGTATVKKNDEDERIKKLWTKQMTAWFGDLGDGTRDGSKDDPRMGLIEVKAEYVVYWKSTMGGEKEFQKEVEVAAEEGTLANTGVMRELTREDLETGGK